jgi:predicted dehydrogenase
LDAGWTMDYKEVLQAGIDLLVTACPSAGNAELVIEAANKGIHIISVKPFAMTMAEADEILAAVERAGVYFIGWESSFRVQPLYQQVKAWMADGRLGDPLAVYCYFRAALPDIAWFGLPVVRARTWWLDPLKVPGGAWIDHGIYMVDVLRWLFQADIGSVTGQVANRRYPDEPLEDYGIATLNFTNGAVATVESTWLADFPATNTGLHFTGSGGQLFEGANTKGLMFNQEQERQVRLFDYGDQILGWQEIELPPEAGGLTAHMLRVLRSEEQPVATAQDARAALEACLAFYDSAKSGQTVKLSVSNA